MIKILEEWTDSKIPFIKELSVFKVSKYEK